MDQLRTAGAFIWTHRFWFSLGLVVIFAYFTQFDGADRLQREAAAREKTLESTFKNVDRYSRGMFPNNTWIETAGQKSEEVTGQIDTIWEELFKRQQKSMTWPEQVAEVFADRPFGADLSDDQNRYLFLYARDGYDTQIAELFNLVDPVREDQQEGKQVGKVFVNEEVIQRIDWGTQVPTSRQAWVAQEEIWIQRGLLRGIAAVNADATSWRDAPIRRILSLGIGGAHLDARTKAKTPEVIDPLAVDAEGNPTGGEPGKGRWIVDSQNRYRTIPVSVSLIVEQARISEVIAGLISHCEFQFRPQQVEVSTPGATEYEVSGSFDVMKLDIWAHMRIYEMPTHMKEALEKKDQPAETMEGDEDFPPPPPET